MSSARDRACEAPEATIAFVPDVEAGAGWAEVADTVTSNWAPDGGSTSSLNAWALGWAGSSLPAR